MQNPEIKYVEAAWGGLNVCWDTVHLQESRSRTKSKSKRVIAAFVILVTLSCLIARYNQWIIKVGGCVTVVSDCV
jgi:hypothetical protein